MSDLLSKQKVEDSQSKRSEEVEQLFNDFHSEQKIRNLTCVYVSDDQVIEVSSKYELEVRPSTLNGAGKGLFATNHIPKDSILMEVISESLEDCQKSLGWFMNDLAYRGDASLYNEKENIEKNINVGALIKGHKFFGNQKMFLFTLRDIIAGEELSKPYGAKYWYEHEFWSRFPQCKWKETHDQIDLPSEYVFLDECSFGLELNAHMMVFVKKIENRYYYAVGYGDYFMPNFEKKIKKTKWENIKDQNPYSSHDITKSDFSQYKLNDDLPNGMHFRTFLSMKEQKINVHDVM
jgi:hypothetical protein